MNTLPEVLIIDDEPEIRELFVQLTLEKFSPLLASNAAEGMALAKSRKPSVILLDILMPGVDGITLCKRLREDPSTQNITIIMLSAANSINNRIKAFDCGADDFISKPFIPEELFARVSSKIRRSQHSVRTDNSKNSENEEKLFCGNLTLNEEKLEATINGKSIVLSSLEFNLTKIILKNKNRILSRKEILSSVWGDENAQSRLIDAHIVSLRKKLDGFDHTFTAIYGIGYTIRPHEKSAKDAPAKELS